MNTGRLKAVRQKIMQDPDFRAAVARERARMESLSAPVEAGKRSEDLTDEATVIRTILAHALPAEASEADRAAFERGLRDDRPVLRVSDLAMLMGITHPGTIRNWLSQGHVPGAIRNAAGYRRFRLSTAVRMVNAIERNRAASRREKETGVIEIPDMGDRDPYKEIEMANAEMRRTRATVEVDD